MKRPTITLPADDYIDVRSIPEMLAEAAYPDHEESDVVGDDGVLRVMASDEYRNAAKAAIGDGTLEVRSKLTLLPIAPRSLEACAAFNGGYVVSRDALKAFARRVGMELVSAARSTNAHTGKSVQQAKLRNDARKFWSECKADDKRTFWKNRKIADEYLRNHPEAKKKVKASTIARKWYSGLR